jgi:hypothetical protein
MASLSDVFSGAKLGRSIELGIPTQKVDQQ